MKHLILTTLLAMTSAVGAWADGVEPVKPSGTGTEADPLLIYTADELLWVAGVINNTITENVPSNYRMMEVRLKQNIDLSSVCSSTKGSWEPIGNNSSRYFKGHFDGEGHTITGLYCTTTTNPYPGLFGYTYEATIEHLTVSGQVTTSTAQQVGLIAAYAYNTRIADCSALGTVAGNYNVGGIAGMLSKTTLTDCESAATVSGCSYVGGIAGYADRSTISRCAYKGTGVNDKNDNYYATRSYSLGGIAGLFAQGSLADCYVAPSATISGYSQVGGLVGTFASYGNEATRCLACANVELGNSNQGGLLLNMNNSNSYSKAFTDLYYSATATLTQRNSNGYAIENRAGCYLFGSTGLEAVTPEQLASGEVTYSLQDGRADHVWGQHIGTDALPVLGSTAAVYAAGTFDCQLKPVGSVTYANTLQTPTINSHQYDERGICTHCSSFEPAPLQAGSYQISRPGQLLWLKQTIDESDDDPVNINVDITADLDFSNYFHAANDATHESAVMWSALGYTTLREKQISGEFRGNGHTISGLYNANMNITGLISHSLMLTVSDLTVEADYSNANAGAGIVHFAGEGTHILRCATSGRMDGYIHGGIAGTLTGTSSNPSSIVDCHNAATLQTLSNHVGGIVGELGGYASIQRCSNTADIKSSSYYVGGVVGYSSGSNASCADCINTGNISGQTQVGGFIGAQSSSVITRCFSTGNVTADKAPAGRFCPSESVVISYSNCYYNSSSPLSIGGELQTISLNECNNSVLGKTSSVIETGRVAWLLRRAAGNNDTWSQRIGTDAVPHLGGDAPVFARGSATCDGRLGPADFTNDDTTDHVSSQGHHISNGHCQNCFGELEEPALSSDGYYLIKNAGNLAWYAQYVNDVDATDIFTRLCSKLRLTADIDLSTFCHPAELSLDIPAHSWTIIGNASSSSVNSKNTFYGTFDGAGHTITGLYFDPEYQAIVGSYGALFYTIGSTSANGVTYRANISNLTLEGDVRAYHGGFLTYRTYDAKVSDVTLRGTLTSRGTDSGAFAATVFRGANFERCASYVDINNYNSGIGGFAGRCYGGSFDRCVNHGNVTAAHSSSSYIGGFVGECSPKDIITFTDCANYGDVLGGTKVGGFVGNVTTTVSITRCLSMGKVTAIGKDAIGGRFCGREAISNGTPTVNLTYYHAASPLIISDAEQEADAPNSEDCIGAFALSTDRISDPMLWLALNNAQPCGFWKQEEHDGIVCPMLYTTKQHTYGDYSNLCGCTDRQLRLGEDGWYNVANAEELNAFRIIANTGTNSAKCRQTADFSVRSIVDGWEPIGTGYWNGIYDGQGHTIAGFDYTSDRSLVALFGFLGINGNAAASASAAIRNLTVEGNVTDTNSANSSSNAAAILCALNYCGTIENCHTKGTLTTATSYAGGIAGQSRSYEGHGAILDCSNAATVTGNNTNNSGAAYGGIVGQANTTIERCFNSGMIKSDNNYYVGGIAGMLTTAALTETSPNGRAHALAFCGNIGPIQAPAYCAGLVGRFTGSAPFLSCYNRGRVAASTTRSTAQPLVVKSTAQTTLSLTDCYYNDNNAAADFGSVAQIYGTPITAGQIKSGALAYSLGATCGQLDNPWGQNLTDGPNYPTIGAPAVFMNDGKPSNYCDSIYGLPLLIHRALKGRAALQQIEDQTDHLLQLK